MNIASYVMLAVGLILVSTHPPRAKAASPIAPKFEIDSDVDSSPDEHLSQVSATKLSPSYHERSSLPAFGKAMYYNPGVMETVLENRIEMGEVDFCIDCVGYAAMLRRGDLNNRIWIQLPDGTVEGPFLVIDVADLRHVPMLLKREWVVDVDYETAMRWRMSGPRLVTLWAEPPLKYRVSNNIVTENTITVDLYRHEKLDYFNQSHEYSGYVDKLFVQ